MIIVWGRIDVLAAHVQEALRLSLEHVLRSRLEPGCIAHNVHVDVENANTLVFHEEWESMAALSAHFSDATSAQFVDAVKRLAVGAPELRIFEATQIG